MKPICTAFFSNLSDTREVVFFEILLTRIPLSLRGWTNMKIAVIYNRKSKKVINLFGVPYKERYGLETRTANPAFRDPDSRIAGTAASQIGDHGQPAGKF